MPEYSIAMGTFDGIHLGHKAVLNSIVDKGFKPIALTFNVPPKLGEKSQLLMTSRDKIRRLSDCGIGAEIMDFNEVRDLSPNAFLSRVKKKFSPKIIATGFNFRFGKDASGDTGLLRNFCAENQIEYICTPAVLMDGEPVSSTTIRRLISDGNVKQAGRLLGDHFTFCGNIRHGDERGRTIGFPTINIPYPKSLVTPKFGVYASFTEVGGELYRSITDIGIRPTFETDYVISETHIFDFSGDLYDQWVRVHLVDFIRKETRFSGLEELKNAINSDKKTAGMILRGISL